MAVLLPLAAVVAVGLVDLLTGPEYGFSLFYLVPIALTAWWLGRWPAVAVGVVAAGAWVLADFADRLPDTYLASMWNGFTRLVIFVAFALLLSVVRAEANYLRRLDAYRSNVLALLADEFPGRLQRLARSIAGLPGRPGADAKREIQESIEDLVAISRNVATLGLMPVPPDRRQRTELYPLVRDAVRAMTGADRVVIGDALRSVYVGVDRRVLGTAIASLIAALLRVTTGHITVIVRRAEARAEIEIGVPDTTTDLSPALAGTPDLSRAALLSIADVLLGIQLARAVVRAHDGDIVATDGGKGVVVTLPLAD